MSHISFKAMDDTRTHCVRGHLLAYWNCAKADLSGGWLACRSCDSARADIRRDRLRGVDSSALLQKKSDEHYKRLADLAQNELRAELRRANAA